MVRRKRMVEMCMVSREVGGIEWERREDWERE